MESLRRASSTSGKGVRDALVADLAPPEARGASMDLRQALFPLSSRSHCSSSAFASRCGPRAARRASRSAFPNCGGTARSFGSAVATAVAFSLACLVVGFEHEGMKGAPRVAQRVVTPTRAC